MSYLMKNFDTDNIFYVNSNTFVVKGIWCNDMKRMEGFVDPLIGSIKPYTYCDEHHSLP